MAVSITTQPSHQKCLEGGTVSFSVTAGSTNPPLTYQWYKDGVILGGQTSAGLVLTNVQKSNEAKYFVIVTDNDGIPVTSSQVSLLVSCEKGLVPILIANTGNPGGHVVTASVEVVGTGDAFRAFDAQITAAVGGGQDGWSTPASTPSGFLQIFFPTVQLVRRYRIYPPAQITTSPLTWTLQASFDGLSWTVIDTRTNVTGWTVGIAKEFTTSAAISYNYFKLVITSNQTGTGTLGISEWILFNDALLNVAISFPSSGARETVADTVDIQVITTHSSNRSIQSVKFYANNALIGTNPTTPYDFNWTNVVEGSFTLTAVVINDLGEQTVSQSVLTVWSTTPASLPPVVVLADPVNNAQFLIDPAIVPISYVVSSPGTYIKEIEVIVDSVVVSDTTGPLGNVVTGTYHWRGQSSGLGAHTIVIRATDYNDAQTLSAIVTITFISNTAGVAKYGTATIMTATDVSSAEPANAVAFVWRFWDSSSSVTTKGASEKVLNRATCPFTVSAFDIYGRFQSLTETGADLTINTPPRLTKVVLPESQQVVPYFVTLVISAKDTSSTPVFAWKDAIGNLLAVSDPIADGGSNFTYVHKVTSVDEKIFLTVGETDDWSNQFVVDFTLPGKINIPPVVSPLSVGLRPKAWSTVLESAFCTTTSPLHQLAGEPILDGVQVPPVWLPGTPNKRLGPVRVLVRNQLDRSTNGIYLATSSRLNFNATIGASGIVANKVQYDNANTLWISETDQNGLDVSAILDEHLVIGNTVVLTYTSTSDMLQLQISNITLVSGGYMVGVVLTDSAGTLATGTGVNMDFGWTKTTDTFTSGVTIQVLEGVQHGGDYFAAVTDYDPEAASVDASVQFAKVNINYDGSGVAKSLIYVESSSEDLVGLNCDAVIDFLTTNSTQTFDGAQQTLLRAKVVTAGIATGDYVATETVSDTSPIAGFVATVTTLKATVSITN